jgi:ketosteroid isomerase-like protein
MMNENSDIVGRNRELIRRMYQAAAAGDMEAFFDSVADEVIVIRSDGHPAPGRWVGKEEMKRALGAKPHPASAQVSEIIADGPERVIVLVDEDFVDQDGKTISMPAIAIFRVLAGKVVEIRMFFWNHLELHRLAGYRIEVSEA